MSPARYIVLLGVLFAVASPAQEQQTQEQQAQQAPPKPVPPASTETEQPRTVQPKVETSPKRPATLDRLELDTTAITGNRELPKVLYIVPWKKSDLGDLTGRPTNSLLDEVLAPVDREVFRRQSAYYETMTTTPAPAAAQDNKDSER
jgi:hypothetical protein